MKTATIYGPRKRMGAELTAFARGLSRHGVAVRFSETGSLLHSDLLVMWGVRREHIIRAQKTFGGELCILERGYVGNRGYWTSVSFGGGLNNRGIFRGLSDDPARFNTHFPGMLKTWRPKPGGYALLIGQVRNDMSLKSVGGRLDSWYSRAAQSLAKRGYQVRFRSHPGMITRGFREEVSGATTTGGALEDALSGAAVCVTFNSNTSVEAVMAGTPTIACDEGCMAWPVVAHGLDAEIVMPEREAWAARMAWCQYSLSEMESGECWARVGG